MYYRFPWIDYRTDSAVLPKFVEIFQPLILEIMLFFTPSDNYFSIFP